MPAPEEAVLAVLREWMEKADNDLTAAVQILKLGKSAPTDTIGFHCQQVVEKYLKTLLIFREIPFPKTHDIHDLRVLLPAHIRPKVDSKTQDRLTRYATVRRYPAAEPDISLPEARQAVALARRVRREVRRLLPRAALRRKKR